MTEPAVNSAQLAPSTRRAMYVGLNVVFMLAVMLGALFGASAEPRALYLCALMLSCSSPLLWMDRLNGRYTLLTIFLAAYFVFYGANDTFGLFDGRVTTTSRGILSAAEIAILLGAGIAIAGYRLALAAATDPGRHTASPAPRDWPLATILLVGLSFWCVGTATDWFWQLNVTSVAAMEGRDSRAMLLVVVARHLQPLGTIMIAYALVVTRSRPLLLLVIALLLVQMLVGFIGNSKETAMRGLIILTMGAFLLQGRIPKAWIAVALAFVVLAFPIFQAYRAEVIGMRGMTRIAASKDVGRSIELALSARKKVESAYSEDYKVPSFIERAALKPTLEMFIAKTGSDVEFQSGATIKLWFTGFIPRFIWPDKPDSSIGKRVNREFRISESPDTYISATHLGELYWNFGWPGIVIGMFAFGFMIGTINTRCDLSERRTLTRLLVLITTIYATIVRFEGSIALEYIVYVRALLLIGILHLVFARVPVARVNGAAAPLLPTARIHAPQLLR